MRLPPAASPPALSSSLHLRPWEASGYLLSSSSGLGVLRLSPSRGGRPSFSRLRGTKPPPAQHRPGTAHSGSAPGRGARAEKLTCAEPLPELLRRSQRLGSRRISRRQVPPTRPSSGVLCSTFPSLGSRLKARRWEVGVGGVIWEKRLKDLVVVCLFVCFFPISSKDSRPYAGRILALLNGDKAAA